MKLIYLHQYFNTPGMNGGTRSYEMARHLVKSGHEVHVIISRRDEERKNPGGWTSTEEDGVIVHWLNVPYSNHMAPRNRIRAFLAFAFAAGPMAVRQRGDLVFATSTPLTIALPAIYSSRRLKVPLVFEVRDLWPEIPIAVGALKNPLVKKAARILERLAYRNSTRVIALSPGMKEGVIATGYPPDQVKIIPNCSDIDLFDVDPELGQELRQKYNWLGRRPLVVYTGTIGQINGVGYMASLAAAVWPIDPEIRFAVIGEGKEEAAVRNRAKQLGVLDRNFFMLPGVPKLKIPAWLSAADIATSFVIDLDALWANSANKFFDTLAAGKPIAINYRGWQADLIQESGAGLILDARDIDESARIIVRSLKNERWLADTGEAAFRLAKERFGRDELALKFENVLSKAVKELKPEMRFFYPIGKRTLDLALAFSLLILLSPVFMAVSLAVWRSLGRPILFRQERPGLNGEHFSILKFRTMREAKNTGGDLASDEQRLTPVGRFLRRTSLDELPELINVIRGDMSLVGPRPLLPAYLDRYTPEQASRHAVKPGITGWAQVNGRNAISWEEKFQLDVWYVKNRSFSVDLKILWITLLKVLKREDINADGHATMPEFTGESE